ncbi:putative amidohydrolase family protein [Aspergillus bombycis]|uniref:6-methylsalicylate decarboxylase n=1 Tax=Aspergillus bombycis TaxID=109264 RepID=A0A1F8ADR4_9EURO|nr:putative amidohydrolase family protein [Aspergillus bombycis]OGM49559.1 putative amidohydrolase family protein [Aspergillus bombycis]
MPATNRIDVHHHFVPDFYREALESCGGDPSGWFIPDWTPELDAKVNKQFGIGTSILSLTAPGACILKDPEASARLARKANEYTAQLRDEKPQEYGFFASLPSLMDKERALKELDYAYDVLKADGVVLFTRYGEDNHYLGHPDFKDIWAALNRRSAVILVHPTHPVDISQVSGLAQPVIRYPFETTQTALDMLYNKTVRNNPNCKIILSHAGGVLPFLIGRPTSILAKTPQEQDAFLDDARNFYYDTAVAGSENVLRVMEKFAKPGHLLYGSDTPYANNDIINYHTSRQDSYQFEDASLADKINRGNGLALFPRLK